MKIKDSLKKFKKTSTLQKLNKIISRDIKDIKNINILEFGVDKGISTGFFSNFCKKNKGTLLSVDSIEYGHLYNEKNWTFINCKDYEIKKVLKNKSKTFDLIFLDTEHTAKHVKKLFYMYYPYLKKNGFFLIDDISWLPYLKNNYRNSEWVENNNRETFNKILEIYNNNTDKFDLSFEFFGSGMAKIIKKNTKKLQSEKKINLRNYSLKNILRKNKSHLHTIINLHKR